jgi:transcriptional regulator with XRE-family HTH domain
MGVPRKPKLRQILGANVRRERTTRSWAQEELAHQAHLSQTYISQLESGQRAVSVDAIERLAGAFDIDPSLLLRKA